MNSMNNLNRLEYKKRDVLWTLQRLPVKLNDEKYLTEHEYLDYSKFTKNKRKMEWLGARVSLKFILMTANIISSPLQCEIVKNRMGCPSIRMLKTESHTFLNCSISHKNSFVCACTCLSPNFRLGIDVELTSPKALKLRKSFVNKFDSLQNRHSLYVKYTILWSCKEAASKALGLGLLLDLKRLSVREFRNKRFSVAKEGKEIMEGRYLFLNDLVVVICIRTINI